MRDSIQPLGSLVKTILGALMPFQAISRNAQDFQVVVRIPIGESRAWNGDHTFVETDGLWFDRGIGCVGVSPADMATLQVQRHHCRLGDCHNFTARDDAVASEFMVTRIMHDRGNGFVHITNLGNDIHRKTCELVGR